MDTRRDEVEVELLLEALKRILKQRGIGYQDIADELEVSLPTVKRILNRSGLPIERMLSICRIAGVELADVLKIAGEMRPRHFVFSKEQDELFADRPAFLGYFMCLAEEGKSPLEIERGAGISRLSTERYLRVLEEVGLLERLENHRVRLLAEPPFGFGPGSRVLRQMQGEFLRRVTEKVTAGSEDGVFALMKPLRLGSGLLKELQEDLLEVLDRYSHFESKSRAGEAVDAWSLCIALAPVEESETPQVVELDR